MLDAARPEPDAALRAAPPRQPRAEGEGRVSSKLRGGRSRVDGLYQRGSAKCLLPAVYEGTALHAVLLNTAGGLTGGDRFDWAAEAGEGSDLIATTQAAERIYRAQPGEIAQVRTRLKAAPGSRLDWLPQETILFDGGALDRRLEIDLAPDAEFLGVEPLILGRAAMGETVRAARLRDAWRLRIDGRLAWADGLRLEGAASDIAGRAACFGGRLACATVVRAGPGAEEAFRSARNLLPVPQGAADATLGAVSLVDGIAVARILARDGRALRGLLMPLLELWRGGALPRPWTM
ncbi:urease accessory protein UreD [Albimonas sp. CAU 1670]|uniref:urease accessory protein UreD n=1 Tax=Albimonas sp. CAU 1670 TaxID=3032599 RepID=UPI0023DC594E|nr:urease accessory protein UreD [Albimonas sp. CAU 1670]MDF2232729.1 urease accessory protein UreD [Albimonas sp. CAU 1670]